MRNLIPAAAAVAPAAPALLSTVAAILPPVLVGLAIGGFVCWVIDESDKQKATEPPAPDAPKPRPQLASPNMPRSAVALARPRIHRDASCKSASRIASIATSNRRVVDLPAPAPAGSSLGNSSAPAGAPVPALAAASVPIAKPQEAALFTRKLTADKLAAVFSNGPLSRQAAVAALVAKGASRSRAYEALREDGPFAAHLVLQADGSISWHS